jgi:HEAT repeat protein
MGGRRARIAAAAIIAGTLMPGFLPVHESGAAYAQAKRSDISGWVKESASSALRDREESVRVDAAWRLRYGVEDGADISPAMAALADALSDSNQNVRGYSAFALTMHHLKRKEWAKAAALLLHKDDEVRANAGWAVGAAAEKKYPLAAFVPTLEKSLSNGNEYVEWNAAKALALHYLGKGQRGKAEELLKKDDEDVRDGAEEAFRRFEKLK